MPPSPAMPRVSIRASSATDGKAKACAGCPRKYSASNPPSGFASGRPIHVTGTSSANVTGHIIGHIVGVPGAVIESNLLSDRERGLTLALTQDQVLTERHAHH